MSTEQMRSSSLYITAQVARWCKWIADLDENEKQVADGVANDMLKAAILAKYPLIEQIEADYWKARRKLDEESKLKLKGTP